MYQANTQARLLLFSGCSSLARAQSHSEGALNRNQNPIECLRIPSMAMTFDGVAAYSDKQRMEIICSIVQSARVEGYWKLREMPSRPPNLIRDAGDAVIISRTEVKEWRRFLDSIVDQVSPPWNVECSIPVATAFAGEHVDRELGEGLL